MVFNQDRISRIEVMREELAAIGGKAFRLEAEEGIGKGIELSDKTWKLSERLLMPEYDNDHELDEAQKKIDKLKTELEQLEKRQ